MGDIVTDQDKINVVIALSHDVQPYSIVKEEVAVHPRLADRVNIIRSSSRDHLLQLIPIADAILCWSLPPDIFASAKRLKWISFASAGVDSALFPELLASDIIITTVSGVHTVPAGEHAIAMMLAFARGLVPAIRNSADKRWGRSEIVPHIFELHGLTVGILGLGHIGKGVARLARALGMKVLGCDLSGISEEAVVDEIYFPGDMEEFLPKLDFLVVALPLTQETRGMIGTHELALVPSSAYIINISRSRIVDDDALLERLRSGKLAGAGLDVFDTEPLPADSPFYKMGNVIVTPHVAGVTPKYWERTSNIFTENLRRFIQGEKMLNVVDKVRGY